MAKVNPMSNNPSFVAKSGANCFEEMDEEEEESDEEIESQDTESIFAPGAENMFEEYMTKRAPDFDSNSLNEDELLRGLPFFRSIHQVYQVHPSFLKQTIQSSNSSFRLADCHQKH